MNDDSHHIIIPKPNLRYLTPKSNKLVYPQIYKCHSLSVKSKQCILSSKLHIELMLSNSLRNDISSGRNRIVLSLNYGLRDPGFNLQLKKVIHRKNLGQVVNLHLLR